MKDVSFVNRSGIEIMVDMIKEASREPEKGRSKSRIMGGNGMSPKQSEYFDLALKRKFLEPVHDGRYTRYRPTKEGYEFVSGFESIEEKFLKKD